MFYFWGYVLDYAKEEEENIPRLLGKKMKLPKKWELKYCD
jgi:hypothetical protein